mmetsp:Transcript_1366/g.1831  ORF Transcript_1366/g.1831 Transcript_1366/m.1831 type:complete len:196 (-) Transcript_1366:226-813(-)
MLVSPPPAFVIASGAGTIAVPFWSQGFSLPNDPFVCTAAFSVYMIAANFLYLSRRSYLRQMSKRKLLQIRTSREDCTTFTLYMTTVAVWQLFVFVFPIVETVARMFGKVSFFYSYPNAGGLGFILEPRRAQHLSISKRTKQQIRFDWHRFSVNVGGIGREGYRHPPSIEMNRPHVDIPSKGLKHWPWRRRFVKQD